MRSGLCGLLLVGEMGGEEVVLPLFRRAQPAEEVELERPLLVLSRQSSVEGFLEDEYAAARIVADLRRASLGRYRGESAD